MNRIAVSAQDFPPPGWSGSLKRFAKKVLEEVKRDNWDLSFLLCADKTIKTLNTRYRNKAEVTDVLSFELGAEIRGKKGVRCLPGDIVISLDTLRENSLYFKISEDEELRRLLIHGILHLDGMDHRTNKKTEQMLQYQECILAKLSGESIIGGKI